MCGASRLQLSHPLNKQTTSHPLNQRSKSVSSRLRWIGMDQWCYRPRWPKNCHCALCDYVLYHVVVSCSHASASLCFVCCDSCDVVVRAFSQEIMQLGGKPPYARTNDLDWERTVVHNKTRWNSQWNGEFEFASTLLWSHWHYLQRIQPTVFWNLICLSSNLCVPVYQHRFAFSTRKNYNLFVL